MDITFKESHEGTWKERKKSIFLKSWKIFKVLFPFVSVGGADIDSSISWVRGRTEARTCCQYITQMLVFSASSFNKSHLISPAEYWLPLVASIRAPLLPCQADIAPCALHGLHTPSFSSQRLITFQFPSSSWCAESKGALDPVCQFCLFQICYVASRQSNVQLCKLGRKLECLEKHNHTGMGEPFQTLLRLSVSDTDTF